MAGEVNMCVFLCLSERLAPTSPPRPLDRGAQQGGVISDDQISRQVSPNYVASHWKGAVARVAAALMVTAELISLLLVGAFYQFLPYITFHSALALARCSPGLSQVSPAARLPLLFYFVFFDLFLQDVGGAGASGSG